MRLASVVVTTTSAVVAVALCGCASAPSNSDVRHDRTTLSTNGTRDAQVDVELRNRDVREALDVPIPAVQAFDALPAAYTKLGIPTVAVVDNTGGVYTIGARNLAVHGSLGGTRLSTYIDCGSGAMRTPANSYDVNLSVTTYVTPKGDGSTLNTMVAADARDPASNSPPVHCSSTGAFERQLANLVAGR